MTSAKQASFRLTGFIPHPSTFTLSAYPNPFNEVAEIQIVAPASIAQVTLTVYNLLGQVVREQKFPLHRGQFTYHLDAADLTTGLYFLRVHAGGFQKSEKLMLLR